MSLSYILSNEWLPHAQDQTLNAKISIEILTTIAGNTQKSFQSKREISKKKKN